MCLVVFFGEMDRTWDKRLIKMCLLLLFGENERRWTCYAQHVLTGNKIISTISLSVTDIGCRTRTRILYIKKWTQMCINLRRTRLPHFPTGHDIGKFPWFLNNRKHWWIRFWFASLLVNIVSSPVDLPWKHHIFINEQMRNQQRPRSMTYRFSRS